MRRVGYYTPETAKMIHDVARYLRDSGFVIPQSGRENQFIPPDAPIYIRNDTAEEIPAFACLQTDGTVEDGGQNFIKVVKPQDAIGTNGWYLFNGIAPIETGGYGIAHDGPVVRMLTDGSTITNGDRWAPVVNSFEVSTASDGVFIAIGADDIETDVMRGFVLMTSQQLQLACLSCGLVVVESNRPLERCPKCRSLLVKSCRITQQQDTRGHDKATICRTNQCGRYDAATDTCGILTERGKRGAVSWLLTHPETRCPNDPPMWKVDNGSDEMEARKSKP
jgi:hypothetical protein